MEDRLTQYPGRIKLTAVEGEDNTYDVERAEGEVYTEGTALNAANLTAEIQSAVTEQLNGVTIDNSGNLIAPNIQAGRGSCPVSAKNTESSVTITFPTPFTVTPNVVVTPDANASDTTVFCIGSVSKTGFTYRCKRTGAWASYFYWIAIGR